MPAYPGKAIVAIVFPSSANYRAAVSFSEDRVTSDPAMVGLVTSTIEKNRVIISEEDVTRKVIFQKSVSHRMWC